MGSKEQIRKAKRLRKVFGGGWRQAGFLAAAGIYALDHHIERLHNDHYRAAALAAEAKNLSFVDEVYPQETNIVIFRLANELQPTAFIQALAENNIKVSSFGGQYIRMVTHLDFDDNMLEKTIEELRKFTPAKAKKAAVSR